MALESGNGRSSGKCPLTSNGYHLHSRRCCHHLTSFCDVSKKCYRCSRLVESTRSRSITEVKQHWAHSVLGWVTAYKWVNHTNDWLALLFYRCCIPSSGIVFTPHKGRVRHWFPQDGSGSLVQCPGGWGVPAQCTLHTPGDWDKPLNGVLHCLDCGLIPRHLPQINKQDTLMVHYINFTMAEYTCPAQSSSCSLLSLRITFAACLINFGLLVCR
jgi:hypothetical protein